jgi:hypothetical protein
VIRPAAAAGIRSVPVACGGGHRQRERGLTGLDVAGGRSALGVRKPGCASSRARTATRFGPWGRGGRTSLTCTERGPESVTRTAPSGGRALSELATISGALRAISAVKTQQHLLPELICKASTGSVPAAGSVAAVEDDEAEMPAALRR